MRESSSLSESTMKKIIIDYKDKLIKATLSSNNTHIEDSYKIKSIDDMQNILWELQLRVSNRMAINKRGIWSMTHEWRAHNLLYSLGIQRDRTKSVDLDINQPWYIRLAYPIISMFYPYF